MSAFLDYDLSGYRIWRELPCLLDEPSLHAIASGDNYDGIEQHSDNYHTLKRIVTELRLPRRLDAATAEGVAMFVFADCEDRSAPPQRSAWPVRLFCSLLLLEIESTQEYDAGIVERDLILAVDACENLGEPWPRHLYAFLQTHLKRHAVRIPPCDLIYYEMARLLSAASAKFDEVQSSEIETHIRGLYVEHRAYYDCLGGDFAGVSANDDYGNLWKEYLSKVGFAGMSGDE